MLCCFFLTEDQWMVIYTYPPWYVMQETVSSVKRNNTATLHCPLRGCTMDTSIVNMSYIFALYHCSSLFRFIVQVIMT